MQHLGEWSYPKCMKKNYEQLTNDERDQIAVHLANGYNQSDIARILGRSRSTISRELGRNQSSGKFYLPNLAQKLTQKRRSLSRQKERMKQPRIRNYVEQKLALQWSPEQISGRISIDHPNLSVSHESIYQYIYSKRSDLIPHLTRYHKKRRKRILKSLPQTIIPNRTFIDHRPELINSRIEFGHWEADCVVSHQNQKSLLVLVERSSRRPLISKIRNRKAPVFSKKLIRRLKPLPLNARRSITYDNGSENVRHEFINKSLHTNSFFCHPYHSWEKGTVENTIGLIRRFFPKKTNFAKITNRQIRHLESLLTHRPRKCLGFKTPAEVSSFVVALTG